MNEKISVIVPIYNVEPYLEKCIDSILNQTYQNLEIILVDDGSPDKCPAICDEYAKKDARIKVIHKENGGLSSARNAGLDVATGEYIAFVDSDDYLHEKTYEKLLCRLLADNADMALCDIYFVNEKDEELNINTISLKDSVWREHIFWQELYGVNYTACVVAWNKLYKAEIFQKLRYPIGKIHEDEFVIHQIVNNCARISVLNEKLYYYLQRGDSIVGQSYTLQRMDVVEGLLARALYFYHKGEQRLSELCLKRIVGCFLVAYKRLDFKLKNNQKRFKELRKQFRKCYKIIKKRSNSKNFIINEWIFCVSIRLYLLTRRLKNNKSNANN